MHSDEFIIFTFGCFCSFVICTLISLGISSGNTDWWQKQCVEHGAAQYNPTTGNFEWKEKVDSAK